MIQKATLSDLEELETLYNALNDYLANHINHPGWIKHIYPTRSIAQTGIDDGQLFVLRKNSQIAGSIILSHEPEEAYDQVEWSVDSDYQDIYVIRTLVVHPDFLRQGIALELMNFAQNQAINNHIHAIRLDVSVNNTPAIELYQKLGYQYRGTVDMGLGYDHLIWFDLYELPLV